MFFYGHSSFICWSVFHLSFKWICAGVLYFHLQPSCLFIVFPSKRSVSCFRYPNLTLVSFAKARDDLLTSSGGPRKTKMCYYANKGCKHGNNCRLGHSESEFGQAREGNAFMTWNAEASSEQPYVLTLRISNRQAHFCL